MIRVGDRYDYGESRFRALGFLDARLHVLVFTERVEDLHMISLRKANRNEMRRYADVEA